MNFLAPFLGGQNAAENKNPQAPTSVTFNLVIDKAKSPWVREAAKVSLLMHEFDHRSQLWNADFPLWQTVWAQDADRFGVLLADVLLYLDPDDWPNKYELLAQTAWEKLRQAKDGPIAVLQKSSKDYAEFLAVRKSIEAYDYDTAQNVLPGKPPSVDVNAIQVAVSNAVQDAEVAIYVENNASSSSGDIAPPNVDKSALPPLIVFFRLAKRPTKDQVQELARVALNIEEFRQLFYSDRYVSLPVDIRVTEYTAQSASVVFYVSLARVVEDAQATWEAHLANAVGVSRPNEWLHIAFPVSYSPPGAVYGTYSEEARLYLKRGIGLPQFLIFTAALYDKMLFYKKDGSAKPLQITKFVTAQTSETCTRLQRDEKPPPLFKTIDAPKAAEIVYKRPDPNKDDFLFVAVFDREWDPKSSIVTPSREIANDPLTVISEFPPWYTKGQNALVASDSNDLGWQKLSQGESLTWLMTKPDLDEFEMERFVASLEQERQLAAATPRPSITARWIGADKNVFYTELALEDHQADLALEDRQVNAVAIRNGKQLVAYLDLVEAQPIWKHVTSKVAKLHVFWVPTGFNDVTLLNNTLAAAYTKDITGTVLVIWPRTTEPRPLVLPRFYNPGILPWLPTAEIRHFFHAAQPALARWAVTGAIAPDFEPVVMKRGLVTFPLFQNAV